MNIDIVNRQVANSLKIDEKKVKLINTFYWQCIREHLYSYNGVPLNIENVCVLYPNATLIREGIHMYIQRIRALQHSKKFKPDSIKRINHIENYKKIIRHLWALRKQKKFTN